MSREPPPDAPITAQAAPTPAELLARLYTPFGRVRTSSWYTIDPIRLRGAAKDGQLPLPPPYLRMGYAIDNDRSYSAGGAASSGTVRNVAAAHGCDVATCGPVMDWGSATGRVLRHFAVEADTNEFWGADQDEVSVTWARENLSPPFHFVTCTAYPHFPFADGKFGLIYGLSVFTHLEHLQDLWLMEIHRVLRPGGLAIFTVHDEHTVRFMAEQGRPQWIPPSLDLEEMARHEITVVHGDHWHQTYVFMTDEYIRRAWGRYLEVLEIRPQSDGYQSAVVLRKR